MKEPGTTLQKGEQIEESGREGTAVEKVGQTGTALEEGEQVGRKANKSKGGEEMEQPGTLP